MRGAQERVHGGQLVSERCVPAEAVARRARGLREVGAVERVGVVQELNPALKQRGHGARPYTNGTRTDLLTGVLHGFKSLNALNHKSR